MKLFILLFVMVITVTMIGCGSTEQREVPVDYPIEEDISYNNEANIKNKEMKEVKVPLEKDKLKAEAKKVVKVEPQKKENKTVVKDNKKENNAVVKTNKDVNLNIKPNNAIYVNSKTVNNDDIIFDTEKKEYYYLRILSLPKHKYHKKNAVKVKKFLDKKYPDKSIKLKTAKDKKKNEFWVIDIGRFATIDEKAKAFKKEIQNTKYQKRKDFYSSFFLKY